MIILLAGDGLPMQRRCLLLVRPAACGAGICCQNSTPSALLRLALDHLRPAAAIAACRRAGAVDLNGLHPRLRLRPGEIDVQEPAVEPCTLHLDPFGEHKGPLELPRRDPAV